MKKINNILEDSLKIIGKELKHNIYILENKNSICKEDKICTTNEILDSREIIEQNLSNILNFNNNELENTIFSLKSIESIIGNYIIICQWNKPYIYDKNEDSIIKEIVNDVMNQCKEYIRIYEVGFIRNFESIDIDNLANIQIDKYIEYCGKKNTLSKYYKSIKEKHNVYFEYLLTNMKPNSGKECYTLEHLNNISRTPYESSYSMGTLVIVDMDSDLIKYFNGISYKNINEKEINDNVIRFKNKVNISKYKSTRKLIEMSNDKWSALSDGVYIYGLVNKNYIDSKVVVTFGGNNSYEIQFIDGRIIKFQYGYSLLDDEINIKDIKDRIKKSFKNCNIDNLISIIEKIKNQNKGSMLVISNKAISESHRLQYQSTLIESIDLHSNSDLVENISKIDGSILIDPNGRCHAISVILDGIACKIGDSSRGARYNSAIKYINGELEKIDN